MHITELAFYCSWWSIMQCFNLQTTVTVNFKHLVIHDHTTQTIILIGCEVQCRKHEGNYTPQISLPWKLRNDCPQITDIN